jgi:hypothetical protein
MLSPQIINSALSGKLPGLKIGKYYFISLSGKKQGTGIAGKQERLEKCAI